MKAKYHNIIGIMVILSAAIIIGFIQALIIVPFHWNTEADIELCMQWAFGDDRPTDRKEWPSRWNQLHPDLFTMYGSDEITCSMEKVGKAYQRRLKK